MEQWPEFFRKNKKLYFLIGREARMESRVIMMEKECGMELHPLYQMMYCELMDSLFITRRMVSANMSAMLSCFTLSHFLA